MTNPSVIGGMVNSFIRAWNKNFGAQGEPGIMTSLWNSMWTDPWRISLLIPQHVRGHSLWKPRGGRSLGDSRVREKERIALESVHKQGNL